MIPIADTNHGQCVISRRNDGAGGDSVEDVNAVRASRTSGEEMFVSNLTLIERLLASVARQHRFSADDAEEFAGMARLRLVSDDYAVLRKFRSQCTLRTFLTVVIQRLCLDFRAAQWGKWRPSARSRRAGDVAILLERLTMRDGLTFEEACSVLECNHALTVERDTLERLYRGFRSRGRPRLVHCDELDETASTAAAPDEGIVVAEHQRVLDHATAALAAALASLAPQDRLILQLRYADGLPVMQIARMLHLDHKWLFRRIDRLYALLRKPVESRGLTGQDVLAALGRSRTKVAHVFGRSRQLVSG